MSPTFLDPPPLHPKRLVAEEVLRYVETFTTQDISDPVIMRLLHLARKTLDRKLEQASLRKERV